MSDIPLLTNLALPSYPVMFISLISLSVAYNIALAIYRVYFHPLRAFPGRPLAVATYWHETYHDVFKKPGGHAYIWQIEKYHERYGPIIRTNPDDIHIHDPDFFDELYATPRADKWQWWTRGFAVPSAGGMTVEHETHRRRRGALNPFFSKAAMVANAVPIIHEKLNVICERLDKIVCVGNREVLDLESIYLAVTTDVLTQLSYGWTYDYVNHPEWAMMWKLINTGGRASAAIVRSFPLIGAVVRNMPLRVAIALVPPVGFMKSWMQRVGIQVRKIKEDPETMASIKTEKRRKDTIFAQILSSDLSEKELSDQRLIDEGVLIATAGSETTAWAITIATYHVMRNPEVLRKLRDELKRIEIPKGCTVASWTELEKLPYLTAVVKEGTRMAGGMLSRLPRIYDQPIQYKEWTIPAGTPISMTPHLVLIDQNIFPDPRKFDPERWLDRLNEGVTTSRLDKYIVAFGKGSRNCIGIHLAYAQLYMCLASIASRYTLEIFETDESDVTPSRDLFTAGVKLESQGIRMIVHGDTYLPSA